MVLLKKLQTLEVILGYATLALFSCVLIFLKFCFTNL